MVLGIALTVLAATCYGLSNVCYGRVRGAPLVHTLLSVLVWNAATLTLVLAVRGLDTTVLSLLSLGSWALIIAVGLLTSLVGRLGILVAIARIGPSRTSTLKNSASIFSLVLGAVLFSQSPSPAGVVGVGTILCGVWLIGREKVAIEAVPFHPRAARAAVAVGSRPLSQINGHDHVVGLVAGLSVAAVFAVADTLRVYASGRMDDAILATWIGSVVALAIVLLACTASARGLPLGRGSVVLNPWLIVAGLASSTAFLANYSAVQHLLVGYVTALLALAPMATALIGKALAPDGEELGPVALAAMAVIVAGTVLIVVAG